MPVSQADLLAQNARDRHERTLQRAHTTLTEMANSGKAITVSLLASEATVSRSWIYTQPELRDRIGQLQQSRPTSASPKQNGDRRASDESLRRRLALAHQRIGQLRTDNQQLRQSLALAHGQLRQALERARQ